ncbi:MAG TPA: hypothetical protein VOA80_00860 [Thermoanaerobaculia bacterium]|nr:hypothetical protein [Thermoanaerobaculia bacterium]
MVEKRHSPAGGQKPFAEFLREAPRSHGSTVTVTGRVTQSSREGHFMLDLGGGQTVELPTEAVRGYKVVEGGENLVEIELHLPEFLTMPPGDQMTGGTRDLIHAYPHSHYIPRAFPGPDPTGQFGYAAAVPFVLACGHQAPQNAVAMQALTGQVAKPVLDVRTISIYDLTTVKETIQDHSIKEVIKDPIYETVKEVYETLVEGGGTIQEGGGGGTLAEGGGFPGVGINQGGI